MFTRRHPEPQAEPYVPERTPHFDPRTEVRLQQILSLRRGAARNELQLDGHGDRVRELSDFVARHLNRDGHDRRLREIIRLNQEITRLNHETAEIHEQVAELCAKLSDDELAFLDGTGL